MASDIRGIRYVQYFASFSVALASGTCSVCYLWTSPSLPILQSEKSPIRQPLTNSETSWIITSVFLSSLIGYPISSWLAKNIGRKWPLISAMVLFIISWITIIFAKTLSALIIGRVLAGFGISLIITIGPIFLVEIADGDIRGKLTTISIVVRLFGNFIVLAVGPYISFASLAIICAIFPLTAFTTLLFVPESPHTLIKKGEFNSARRSLKKFSAINIDDQIDRLMIELQYGIERGVANKSSIFEIFSQKSYRKPIIINLCIQFLSVFSGSHVIESYLQSIIQTTNSIISPQESSIIFGVGQLLGGTISCFLMDKLGRKPIFVISALVSSIALYSEGTYFYVRDVINIETTSMEWLPTTSLAIFLVMISFGVTTVPYVLLGELVPANIKEIVLCICGMFISLLFFALTKSFNYVSETYGLYAAFWQYASTCIVGAIFVIILLPETKGKSLADIQDKISSKGQRGSYDFQ